MTLLLGQVHPGLTDLVTGIRAAVDRRANWGETARLVGAAVRSALPPPDVLTPRQRLGDPTGYASHILHTEPDGAFSIVGLVWRPGQQTPIHDHVTWCVFGVLQGVEHEERYLSRGGHLLRSGVSENHVGQVNAFAPPGDIHLVRNLGDEVAISLHVYGTDVARIGSSVRRRYDLPAH